MRRNRKRLEKLQAEEQKQLQEKIRLEERKLLLAQRNLQSIRLIAELLSRAKVRRVGAGALVRGPGAAGASPTRGAGVTAPFPRLLAATSDNER